MSKQNKLPTPAAEQEQSVACATEASEAAISSDESPADLSAVPDTAPAEAPEAASECDVEGTLVVVKPPQDASGLNIRSGPGRQFAVLNVLPTDSVAAVLDLPLGVEVPGWALVYVDPDLIGWVDCRYIQAVEG